MSGLRSDFDHFGSPKTQNVKKSPKLVTKHEKNRKLEFSAQNTRKPYTNYVKHPLELTCPNFHAKISSMGGDRAV